MKLSFILSMPRNNSWNGKWSGQHTLYARVVSFTSKKGKENTQNILDKGYFTYDFGDNWCAGITVKEVSNEEARKIKKLSKGFCGYDWMIGSIIDKGVITTK
jgi:hypothetical protein